MPQKLQKRKSNYSVCMKRSPTSPWVKIYTTGDRDYALRLVNKYSRDYPNSEVDLLEE